MAGDKDNTTTTEDNDPAHPKRPAASPLTNGQGGLSGLDLSSLGGAGGLGQMFQALIQMIMQMFHAGSANLGDHDANARTPAANANAARATAAVQQSAPGDPQAKALIDGYNTSANGVQAAMVSARQTPNASSFLALQTAEMTRSMARADIVKYDAAKRGDNDQGAHADKWKESAQGVKSALMEIQTLPAAQQQQALDKFAQDHPNSALAQDWKKFESGDMSKWTSENNASYTSAASMTRTASAAAKYELPGEALSGADKLGLTDAFKAAAANVPPPAAQPAPSAPALVTQRTVSTQTFNA